MSMNRLCMPVVLSGRYCIMELPMGDNFDSGIRYTTREFIADKAANLDDNTISLVLI